MKITVIGSGNMASGFVKQLTLASHSVQITSRNAAQAAGLAQTYGAQVVGAAEGTNADVIVLATGFSDAIAALSALGDLNGKTVIDITNPLTADYMGLTMGHSTSAAEQIAAALPGVHLVKAFNTIFAQLLAAGSGLPNGQKVSTFVASDDAAAKEQVTELARSMGFNVVDAGALKNARYLEPLAGFNIYLGYGAGLGTAVSPAWISA